jgi:hypothetical protein
VPNSDLLVLLALLASSSRAQLSTVANMLARGPMELLLATVPTTRVLGTLATST